MNAKFYMLNMVEENKRIREYDISWKHFARSPLVIAVKMSVSGSLSAVFKNSTFFCLTFFIPSSVSLAGSFMIVRSIISRVTH